MLLVDKPETGSSQQYYLSLKIRQACYQLDVLIAGLVYIYYPKIQALHRLGFSSQALHRLKYLSQACNFFLKHATSLWNCLL